MKFNGEYKYTIVAYFDNADAAETFIWEKDLNAMQQPGSEYVVWIYANTKEELSKIFNILVDCPEMERVEYSNCRGV